MLSPSRTLDNAALILSDMSDDDRVFFFHFEGCVSMEMEAKVVLSIKILIIHLTRVMTCPSVGPKHRMH